jgi:hypothetical protein
MMVEALCLEVEEPEEEVWSLKRTTSKSGFRIIRQESIASSC